VQNLFSKFSKIIFETLIHSKKLILCHSRLKIFFYHNPKIMLKCVTIINISQPVRSSKGLVDVTVLFWGVGAKEIPWEALSYTPKTRQEIEETERAKDGKAQIQGGRNTGAQICSWEKVKEYFCLIVYSLKIWTNYFSSLINHKWNQSICIWCDFNSNRKEINSFFHWFNLKRFLVDKI